MTLDTTTPAVVLKLDRNATHHGELGAIRSLGRLGVPVYGVHEAPLTPAAGSRYLCGRWVWRRPVNGASSRNGPLLNDAEDVQRLRAGLVTLAERIGRRSVLIPTDHAGAIFLAEHGERLRQWFLFPEPPTELPRRLADRYTLHELCRELDVPGVDAALPGSAAEAEDFADRVGFPLVAKPTTPWRVGGRSSGWRGMTVLHNRDELVRAYRSHAQERGPAGNGPELMLQDYIPRCPSQDFFFYAYCDAGSRCRPGFVGVRERCYPAHTGLTSLGRWVDNVEVHQLATELVSRMGFRGIVDLGYRWDPRDGRYKLLHVNPSLGPQFRLFQDAAGVDVVVAAHLDLTGRPVSSGSPLPGRRLLVENYDPIAALDYRRSGELNLFFWMASLRLVDEMAWFARDDLAPFGLMCLRTGWQAMVPITRGLTRSLTRGLNRGLAARAGAE